MPKKSKQVRAGNGDKILVIKLLLHYPSKSEVHLGSMERVAVQLCRELCRAGTGFDRDMIAERIGLPRVDLDAMMDG